MTRKLPREGYFEKEIRAILNEEIDASGLSISEVAREAGASRAWFSRFLSGEPHTPLARMDRFYIAIRVLAARKRRRANRKR